MLSHGAGGSFSSVSTDDASDAIEKRYVEIVEQENRLGFKFICNPQNVKELRLLKRRHALPPFDAVLLGSSTVEPWTPHTFLNFLESERSEEHFLFFQEVEWLRASKAVVVNNNNNQQQKPDDELLFFPISTRKDEMAWVDGMRNEFVIEDAPSAINISHSQRTSLLEGLATAKLTKSVDPKIFDEAQAEVRRLLLQDAFPRFMARMTTRNVNAGERKHRFKVSVLCLVCISLIVGLVLGLYGNIWLMFICLPFIVKFWDGYIVYSTGVCPISAEKSQFILRKDLHPTNIDCPLTKRALKLAAKRVIKRMIFFSILTQGFLIALPFMVNAGQKKTLYPYT